MKFQSLHNHTTYSDGACTVAEMTRAAIGLGFSAIGFSEHGWTPYDGINCIAAGNAGAFMAGVRAAARDFAGKIEVYLGFESDAWHPVPKEGLDYTILSSHYIFNPETCEHYSIDYREDMYDKSVNLVCGGDVRRFAAKYFADFLVAIRDYKPDIIGHIDLIRKMNHSLHYFDERDEWYRRLLDKTAEAVAGTGCIVEVNTGGIKRAGLPEPYPSRDFIGRLHRRGARFCLSSDAHDAESLDYWYTEARLLLLDCGVKKITNLLGGRFVEVEL